MHLSATEWKRFKENTILITGLFRSKTTSYDNVVIRKHIKAPLKRSTTNGSPVHWHEMNLSDIKVGYTIIATTVEELNAMIECNNIILIDSTEGIKSGRATNNESRLSGYIMLAVMQLNKTINRNEFKWGRGHFNTVHIAKNHIMTLFNKHH